MSSDREMIAAAMDEVRAGNVVLWVDRGVGVVMTGSPMTNVRARPNSPAMNRLRDDLIAAREALELEAEEREAQERRDNVERPEV